ncbi:MAG: HlyD family secretion protein [Gemmatimonadales bacterium]
MSEKMEEAAESGGARRMMWLIVLGVAVVGGGVWGVRAWRFGQTHVSTDNAQVDAHVVPVLAKVGGYVESVEFDDNERVQRGELVVVLDDADLQVRLHEAEADLAAALAATGEEGVVGQVDAEASATRARREALEARLTAANAHKERTARDLERIRDLADKRIASSQQLDAAEASAAAAEADVAALERDVAAARAAETSASAATRAADARLQRAKVLVAAARRSVEYAQVSAPISGIVSRTQVEVGQLVQPGQPLAVVVADSALWITANLKETETSGVRPGQGVVIEVDAYPGCEARGSVESVSPATGSKFALLPPDNATGNFTKVVQRVPVRIDVVEGCGADRPLRAGMSVVAHIEIG